jgi:RNA polymerase sigma-70 factor (ECF subfamily)
MTLPPDRKPAELLLTTDLLRQAKQGDPVALNHLLTRYLPRLQRWASGRLPGYARSLLETTDLVHETLLKAIAGLDSIDVHRPGGFQAYVRQAILNGIRDQVRWAKRRPGSDIASKVLADHSPSPLENAIGTELFNRYERARAQLSDEERLLVHLKIELDLGYAEIAAMTERPSRDAARMAVQRAARKLAGIMGHEH